MKIHILSLQRTGSKNLYNAIHSKLPDPVVFSSGDTLGEVLHGWGAHGYKFGDHAQYPFDPRAEVVFRTAKDFDLYEGRNFYPCIFEDGQASWVEHEYQPTWEFEDAISVYYALMHQDTKDVLVKTQLMDGSFDDKTTQRLIEGWDWLISLTPKDPVRWVCSNYLCDVSGVFVPIKEQQVAAAEFQACRVTIPTTYIREKFKVLRSHWQVINRIKTPIIGLFTEDLSTVKTIEKLRLLGLGDIEVPLIKEFSAVDYRSMIFNYDEVMCEAANIL